MTYVACCHSATYSFTRKPEKEGAKWLTKPVIANRCINVLCKQLCS